MRYAAVALAAAASVTLAACGSTGVSGESRPSTGATPSVSSTPTHSPAPVTTHPAMATPTVSARPASSPTPSRYAAWEPDRSDNGTGYQFAISDSSLLVASDIYQPNAANAPYPNGPTVSFSQYVDKAEPTLICQGAYLSTLRPSEMFTRNFQTSGGHALSGSSLGAPVVREAVLGFPTPADASAALDTIDRWMVECPETLAPASVRACKHTGMLSDMTARELAAADGAPVVRGHWNSVSPQCPSPGDGVVSFWQYAGRSGNRILVFQYSRGYDAGMRTPDTPFLKTLEAAGARASQ